jgi:hypothetical protein
MVDANAHLAGQNRRDRRLQRECRTEKERAEGDATPRDGEDFDGDEKDGGGGASDEGAGTAEAFHGFSTIGRFETGGGSPAPRAGTRTTDAPRQKTTRIEPKTASTLLAESAAITSLSTSGAGVTTSMCAFMVALLFNRRATGVHGRRLPVPRQRSLVCRATFYRM